MKKSELLRALQTEIQNHSLSTAHSAESTSELWNNLSATKRTMCFRRYWIGYPVHKLSLAVQYRTALEQLR
jgi:hypothetical protein